ncbi:hypothetical protein Tcan_18942 [Toxocara canis]|uniref:Uncharacterized protein n=1 Tax=Toxocara canis TaxID=6265 RepID=A0A0B2W5S5_TOXCA|nr:hypothetical protein Tcan_18942 [Toxocara canis]
MPHHVNLFCHTTTAIVPMDEFYYELEQLKFSGSSRHKAQWTSSVESYNSFYVTATTVNYSRDKESMKIAATLITVVVVISEIAPPFSAGLPEGLVNSRESVRLKRHPQGYGYGTGSYFYGHYGGGVNNNYGGVNIGAINRKNINL